MLVWALNWIFFDIDGRHQNHALTRNFYYGSSYVSDETNVVMGYHTVLNFVVTGYTLAGAALPQIVVASDCKNSDPSELSKEYADISQDPLSGYVRWYFAGGLALGTMAMGTRQKKVKSNVGFLQLLHKGAKYKPRIRRRWRLGFRCLINVTWVILPLSGVNSLYFLSIITATCYLILFLEIWGQSPAGSTSFQWKDDWDDGFQEVHGGDHRMIRTIYGFF